MICGGRLIIGGKKFPNGVVTVDLKAMNEPFRSNLWLALQSGINGGVLEPVSPDTKPAVQPVQDKPMVNLNPLVRAVDLNPRPIPKSVTPASKLEVLTKVEVKTTTTAHTPGVSAGNKPVVRAIPKAEPKKTTEAVTAAPAVASVASKPAEVPAKPVEAPKPVAAPQTAVKAPEPPKPEARAEQTEVE
jgi:hypothetical protein